MMCLCYRTLLYRGDFWFLSALFVSRLIYWIIAKLSKENDGLIYLLCIFLFIVGYYMQYKYPTQFFWWLDHALLLIPFIALGQAVRKNGWRFWEKKKHIYVFVWVLTIILSYMGFLIKDCFYYVPGITQGLLNTNWSMFLPLVLLSVFGSTSFLLMCKKLRKIGFWNILEETLY